MIVSRSKNGIARSALLIAGFCLAVTARAQEADTTSSGAGRLIGLCVGISRYKHEVPNLRFADQDARRLANAISQQNGRPLYGRAEATAITNEDASRENLTRELDRLTEQVTDQDTVIILLSGQGSRDQDQYYFMTYDADPSQLSVTAIPWDDMVSRLVRVSEKSKRVLVLLDTARSGSVVTNEDLVKAVLNAKAGVMAFASSRGSEVSYEIPDVGQGAFTKALLEAMEGQPRPGTKPAVTLWEIISYVQRRVRALTEDRQHPQVPFLIDLDVNTPIFALLERSTRAGRVPRIRPAVRILNPKPNESITANTVRVRFEASDDKAITGFRISANGLNVPNTMKRAIEIGARGAKPSPAGLPKGHKIKKTYSVDVPLPPGARRVILRVVVYDNEKGQADASVRITRANVGPTTGNLYLLSVGVSKYRDSQHNLSFAAQDAQAVTAALQSQQGKQYANVYASVLTDEKVTVANIRQALTRLKSATPADTVMVFLSGHGVLSRDRVYFASHGLDTGRVESTCLPWSEVVQTLSSIYAQKMLFADICRAGSSLGASQLTSDRLIEATSQQLQNADQRAGVVLFTACQGEEVSFEEAAAKQGVFALALLEALRGRADTDGDGAVTLAEMLAYVPGRVSGLAGGKQNPLLMSLQDLDPQTRMARLR